MIYYVKFGFKYTKLKKVVLIFDAILVSNKYLN